MVQYYRLAVNVCAQRAPLDHVERAAEDAGAQAPHTDVGDAPDVPGRGSDARRHAPGGALVVQVEREGRALLIAQCVGIPLARQPGAILNETLPAFCNRRTDILDHLLADGCELCEADGDIEVRHIRKRKDLRDRGDRNWPPWRETRPDAPCSQCHRMPPTSGVSAIRHKRTGASVRVS